MQQVAATDPLIGQTIGNYVVQSKLGEGGMGAVYLAEHPLIGKRVALKVLHAEFSHNDEIAQRFLNEAKAVNDIGHPNIVDILDFGRLQDGHRITVYFIMEFLGGRSLAHALRTEAPLPPERALPIALQIADALSASHKRDIVHRDLKPDNVMLIQRGRQMDFVKVLDFGIAKLTGDQPGSRRTRTGIVMGTPAYMSPEQCEGKGNVDHRTDIYALGILLFEMLTGQVPFRGEGFGEVLVQHLTKPPIRPSQITPVIPPHVEAVVLKALEKPPAARYPNMDVFMQALADPVGFVESHGGISGFLAADLSNVSAAPMPMMQPTPLPGQLTPVPGQMTPGHLSGVYAHPGMTGSGQHVVDPPPKNGTTRVLVVLLAMLGAIGLGLGAYFLLAKKDAPDEEGAVALAAEPDAAVAPKTSVIGPDKTGPDGEQVTDQGVNNGVSADGKVLDDGQVEATPPEQPESVTLKVITDPTGADVYVGEEEEPRGQTPLELPFDKGAEKVEIVIRRDDYKDETRSFVPETNQEFDLKLTRVSKSSRKSSDRKKTDKKKTDKKKTDKDLGLEAPDWD